jgi:RecA-family ATPase
MQTLDRSLKGIVERTHVPFTGLAQSIKPGPGHIVLVTGATGVGKSAFALWWALHMPTPALYLSLDSDLPTQAARTVSMMTGYKTEDIEGNLDEWENYLATQQKQLPMMFDHPIKVSQLESVVKAFEEFYSGSPSLIVVDNYKNVVGSSEFASYADAHLELIRVAKKYKTTILLLHHVNRSSRVGRGDSPPEVDSGKFGGEDDSPFVLSLWNAWSDYIGPILNIRVNKNRFGPHGHDVSLVYDYSRMQFSDA